VAERVGDFPSPTILVDGRDVMTGREVLAGVSACRLDLLTARQVLQALQQATASPSSQVEKSPAELAAGVTRDRITALSPAARRLHKAILRVFATTGTAPDSATLAEALAGDDDLHGLLAELHEHDVVRLDEHGAAWAAYPFSGVPTAHLVAIDGGPTVYAMCAVDALGMADMLGRDITVTSTDPACGGDVCVQVTGGQATWSPHTAVVFVGSDTTATAIGNGCCPPDTATEASTIPAADRCCAVMNFFASPDSAKRWLQAHADVSGVILTPGQALRLGVDVFGSLLDDQP
jgi:hypothetical protein